MKRHFIFSVMSAVTLMGLTAVTSCSSSSDEVKNVNPGYDPANGEVPVNFVFNVGMNTAANTRQGEDATQAATSVAADKFRGIIGAHIMCFKQADNGQFLATPATAAKDFDMAQVAVPGTLSSTESRRVLEMSLPLKTNTIVFYGKAAGSTNKNEHGHLDDTDGYGVNKDLTQTSFHLGKRLTDAQKTVFTQTQSLLAAVMTCIMNVHRGTGAVASTLEPAESVPAYGFDIPAKVGEGTYLYDVKWSDYVPSDGKKSPVDNTIDLTSLEEKLGKVYKEMTTIQTAELRNGSGTALKSTVKNLWSIVNSVRCATPTNLSEAVAKHLAQKIHEEILKYFEANVPTNGGSVTEVTIKGVETIIEALSADNYWPAEADARPSTFSAIDSEDGTTLAQYPENLDLPQGSTHVKFDNEKKSFYYVENYNTSAVGGSAFTVDDYYYPAELLYFGNSPIRVTDDEHVVVDYPQGTTAWDTEAKTATTDSWYGWTANGEVQSSTRSVAMRNDINYGTALLQTTVGYTAEVAGGTKKLQDNNHVVQLRDYGVDEANNQITPTNTSFKLVGIVIGGQSPRVGWNFLPALAGGEKQGYIFDKAIANDGTILLSGSDKNYTLVFDNYNATAAQDKVYISLELQNNTGADFMGKDNLIPNGSNFYLIGELDPSGKAAPTWPTYHALPPYTNGTTMNNVSRIFIQDYKTVANFKIGEYSLQYAYLTVPDLRSGSVTLGLSVDLSWSTGLTFDEVILGGGTQTPNP